MFVAILQLPLLPSLGKLILLAILSKILNYVYVGGRGYVCMSAGAQRSPI